MSDVTAEQGPTQPPPAASLAGINYDDDRLRWLIDVGERTLATAAASGAEYDQQDAIAVEHDTFYDLVGVARVLLAEHERAANRAEEVADLRHRLAELEQVRTD